MKKQIFKIKAETVNDELFVEGWAVKYGVTDETMWKDKLLYGCCTKTLKENGKNIKLLFEHNRERVIGKIVNFEDSFEGLYIKAKISEAEPELKIKIREGLYDSMSIGFVEIKSTPIMDDKGAFTENQISEIALKEISVVSFPAFKKAKFGITKSLKEIIENEPEDETELIDKIKSLVEPSNHSDSKPIDDINLDNIIKNFKLKN
jgi:HK97 family phage prohead protease